MTLAILPGATSQSVYFKAIDNTTGLAATTLASATAGIAISYQNTQTGTVTAITLSDLAATNSAWSSGGMKHIAGGVYRLCLPDAAVPATEGARTIIAGTATAFQILGCELVGKPAEVVSGSLVAASVSGAVGSVTGAVGSVATGGITAASIATGAIDADALAADAVAEIAAAITAGATAAEVWSYASRTLTQSAAAVTAAVSGSTITATRGDTLTAAITGLGAITGYTALWFTVKAAPTTEADSAAKVQITQAGGLIYLNGAAATAGQGSITVNSAATGAITIVLAAAASAALAAPSAWVYDVQWKDASGLIHTLTRGTFLVTDDVTRATS